MTDKPIAAKILLTLADRNSTGVEFIALSGSLYQNNLIFGEPRELRQNKNVLELTIIFRDTYSFKNWYKIPEIENHWSSKLDVLLVRKPQTIKERDVPIEVDCFTNCTCGKTTFYILQGRSLKFTNELTCNNCMGQVPYSGIPLKIEIEGWQSHYERVYLDWLDSGIFEKMAYKELTNYKKGRLNTAGEKIRKQLSKFFKLPVYINYFVEEIDNKDDCPVCGGHGTKSGLKLPGRICKKCNTAFGYRG